MSTKRRPPPISHRDPEVGAIWVATPNQFPLRARHASRSSELRDLYEAVPFDCPVQQDGRWGMATLAVIRMIMDSARERREINLSHQVPARS